MTKRARVQRRPRKSISDAWYRVDAATKFALKRGQGIVEQGHGEIVKLSQHELLLHAETRIPAGMEIELEVPWPGCERSLVLRLTGRTVGHDGSQVMVRLMRSEFQMPERLRIVPEPSTRRPQARLAPGVARTIS